MERESDGGGVTVVVEGGSAGEGVIVVVEGMVEPAS